MPKAQTRQIVMSKQVTNRHREGRGRMRWQAQAQLLSSIPYLIFRRIAPEVAKHTAVSETLPRSDVDRAW